MLVQINTVIKSEPNDDVDEYGTVTVVNVPLSSKENDGEGVDEHTQPRTSASQLQTAGLQNGTMPIVRPSCNTTIIPSKRWVHVENMAQPNSKTNQNSTGQPNSAANRHYASPSSNTQANQNFSSTSIAEQMPMPNQNSTVQPNSDANRNSSFQSTNTQQTNQNSSAFVAQQTPISDQNSMGHQNVSPKFKYKSETDDDTFGRFVSNRLSKIHDNRKRRKLELRIQKCIIETEEQEIEELD